MKTFTVDPIEGPFGVVQRLADAVAREDWNGAAAIDRRIANDLATLGELNLANEYTVFTDKRWIPVDPVGRSDEVGTIITGAFFGYNETEQRTYVQCEKWSIDTDGKSMGTAALPPPPDAQEGESPPGHVSPNDVRSWIETHCVEAANRAPTTTTGSPKPQLIDVPDVRNKSLADATTVLEQTGFNVTHQSTIVSDAALANIVVQQNPAGGKYARGSTITLTVGTRATVRMPPVEGLTEAEARKSLTDVGLLVDVTLVTVPAGSPNDGLVISQSQPPGTDLQRGTTVKIQVGKAAPAPTTTT